MVAVIVDRADDQPARLLNAHVAIVLDSRASLLAAFAGRDTQPGAAADRDKELLVVVGQDKQSRAVADRDS